MKTSFLRGIFTVSVAAAALCLVKGTIEAASNQDPRRKEYADRVRASYNYRFGTDKPSTPGNASMEGEDFIQPGAFPDAQVLRALSSGSAPPMAASSPLEFLSHTLLPNQRQYPHSNKRN